MAMANEQVAYMKVLHGIFKNLYQDSVSLMQVSASIINLPGIKQASVVMGSETNLIQLRDAGLGDNIAAGPNDLIIAIMGKMRPASRHWHWRRRNLTVSRRLIQKPGEGWYSLPAWLWRLNRIQRLIWR